MKRSVGLVMLAEINGEVCAVLQRRGVYNFAENKFESYPGACQITAHGKLEEGETFEQGLLRETWEELGLKIEAFTGHKLLIEEKKDDSPEKEGKHIKSFGIFPHNGLKYIQEMLLEPGTGGLVLLPKSKLSELKILDPKADKQEGVRDRDTYKMFADEIAAITKAFELLT